MTRYAHMKEPRAPTVLVVGNPAFDAQVMALPRLPGAEAEANRVAELYTGAHLLVGRQATKRALLQYAKGSNVVHFAGHGVVRPDAPLLSHLVLAPDEGGASGVITAQELFDIRLRKPGWRFFWMSHGGRPSVGYRRSVVAGARAIRRRRCGSRGESVGGR